MATNAPETERVFLDLDRTVIDTDRAKNRFNEVLEQAYDLDPQVLQDEREQYYTRADTDSLPYYSLFVHLHDSYGLEPDRVAQELNERLTDESFMYDDVPPFLGALRTAGIQTSFLTHGEERYQLFKAGLHPDLKDYDVAVVQRPKAEYIRVQPRVPSCVIDDLRIPGLPEYCQGIQIDRDAAEPLHHDESYLVVNSLTVVTKNVLQL